MRGIDNGLIVFKRKKFCHNRALQPATTGPFTGFAHEEVLVLADQQNLDGGARDLGRKLAWGTLARVLREKCKSAYRHVCFAQPRGNNGQSNYFRRCGWTPHPKAVRMVRTWRGTEREANVDFIVALFAGLLADRCSPTLILVCSGDGRLVENIVDGLEMAARIGLIPNTLPVATLSVARSTEARLRAGKSSRIVANLSIGSDCLRDRS